MPLIPFTKGHGTGNDFVIISDPDGALDLSDDQVAALCDRRFGIGADGVVRVVRSVAIAEGADAAASGAEWFMDYRNSDGSKAEMCGNGIRVFARYLADSQLATIDSETAIGTRSGVKAVTRTDGGFEVDLGPWRVDDAGILVRARGLDVTRPGLGIDLGNPHIVVALQSHDELERLDLTVAPMLDPQPEAGANIEFVVPGEPLVRDGIGMIRMRVFERAVGETLSCGTGVAAAALAVREWAGAGAPDRWSVEVPGGQLGVRMRDGHVLLSGPAVLVYTGEVALV